MLTICAKGQRVRLIGGDGDEEVLQASLAVVLRGFGERRSRCDANRMPGFGRVGKSMGRRVGVTLCYIVHASGR